MPVPSFKRVRWNGTELRSVESCEFDENTETEAIKTVTPEREAIGFRDGIAVYSISIEARELVPAEVDWRGHLHARDENLLEVEIPGGQVYQYGRCRVTQVTSSHNADGDLTLRITVMALRRREI